MFNVKQSLQRALLALSLVTATVLAQAEPVSYHVNVNTATLSGTGFFDIDLGASPSQTPLTAMFSNFSGGFNGIEPAFSYNYAVTGNGFSLSNDLPAYVSQAVNFGGPLGFDVMFSGDFLTTNVLEISPVSFFLFDSSGVQLSNVTGFTIAAFGADRIGVAQDSTFFAARANEAATAVPEPAAPLLLLTGLLLMGAMVKRRQA